MMASSRRVFAVVPAAGLSRRMGRPKLLLPLGGSTVISRLLAVLARPEITETFVVVRRGDESLAREIETGAATVVSAPEDPPDMRASVHLALEAVRRRYSPTAGDAWMLVPADHPLLDARMLDALLAYWGATSSRILVPTYHGRRGHPTLFCWDLADALANIPPTEGINRLLADQGNEVTELAVNSPSILTDLNTPDDYHDLLRSYQDT